MQAAVVNQSNGVGPGKRGFEFVGRKYYGFILFAGQTSEQRADFIASRHVEKPRRFVEQNHRR